MYNPSSIAQFMVDVQSLDRRLNVVGTSKANSNKANNNNARSNYRRGQRGSRGGRGG